MKTLLIINEGPYGNERSFNALRLATALAKHEGEFIRIFLIGDGAICGQRGQKTPNGYYNVERMLKDLLRKGAEAAI